MSRRNRKKRRNDGFLFPAPFAGAVGLVLALGLGYVWLESRCQALGREIAGLERAQSALEDRRRNEEYKWSQLKSLPCLERALKRMGLHMEWPRSYQVTRLREAEVFGEEWGTLSDDSRQLARLERIHAHE